MLITVFQYCLGSRLCFLKILFCQDCVSVFFFNNNNDNNDNNNNNNNNSNNNNDNNNNNNKNDNDNSINNNRNNNNNDNNSNKNNNENDNSNNLFTVPFSFLSLQDCVHTSHAYLKLVRPKYLNCQNWYIMKLTGI